MKATKYATISYMQYLLKQQKALERGTKSKEGDDDDDMLSDDGSSIVSDNPKKETLKGE